MSPVRLAATALRNVFAASVNCGYTRTGLPIGLQIAGKRFDDLGVLQVARAFESIRDPQRPWPSPPAQP